MDETRKEGEGRTDLWRSVCRDLRSEMTKGTLLLGRAVLERRISISQ